jgi:rhamnose utilization protein RhaD (predicted bifunctional aldolase and dehydrogenase)/NAD(P)-dependent dehydrogenase (short-subunit alcohol dehydrogenase family)
MQSQWSDADAAQIVAEYARRSVAEDVALRVYTSRLLGRDPRLVQHGGGNTSLKTTVDDAFGAPTPVLCVKGSGWDMADIEPQGLPAVRMALLLNLRRLNSLSDEAMVDAQRGALMSASAPNPSVETLLHAWIPARYIDHTHANAVLVLTDQPDGEAICRGLYGDRLAIVPYCMPGFALAQLAASVFETNPAVQGMVLLKHGIFTWGESAREAYERMIGFVEAADAVLRSGDGRQIPISLPQVDAPPTLPLSTVAPIVRGALALACGADATRRVVLEHRDDPLDVDFSCGRELERYARAGTVTPDHVIRIKPWPLILPAPVEGEEATFAEAARAAATDYVARYRAYFERHNAIAEPKKTMLDPYPRWVVVPGVGLFAAGLSAKEARVAADVAETNAEVIACAETVGRFESIAEADLFDMEYWSLEQAKLGKAWPAPLAGRVVAITGGAGAIGAATAHAFAAQGASVAVVDQMGEAAGAVAQSIGERAFICDITEARGVDQMFEWIAKRYGGLDILVSNAGAAFTGPIGEVDDQILRRSFELNFFAHQAVAQAALQIFKRQGTGGCLLFNVSKQAVNPGPDFGPYGLPKAATLALMRQYAVEYGAIGVRSNAVNADRIRSGLLTDAMVAQRSAARGVSEKDYMSGNLLGREVTAEDVAQAFVSLALAEKTTAAVLTVDGGNIAAAMR